MREGKSRLRRAGGRQCYWSHFPRILLLPVFVMKKEECRVQPLQGAHNISEQPWQRFSSYKTETSLLDFWEETPCTVC